MTANRITYVVAIVASALALVMTNAQLALACLVVLVVLGVLMFAQVNYTARLAKFTAHMPEQCYVYETGDLEIVFSHRLFFMAGIMDLNIETNNRVFGIANTFNKRYLTPFGRAFSVTVPGSNASIGRNEVMVRSAVFRDMLGLFSHTVPMDTALSIAVLPHMYAPVIAFSRMPQARSGGDMFDRYRRGNDVSEVFDVRDYEPGDTLQAIHWKLSSKLDTLITKEFSNPSDYNIVVGVDASRNDGRGVPLNTDSINAVLSVGVSLIDSLLRVGVPHDAVVSSDSNLAFNPMQVPHDIYEVVEQMIDRPLPVNYPAVAQRLDEVHLQHSFTKVILVTAVYDEDAWLRLAMDCSLSVFFVAESSATGGSMSESYDFTVLSPDDLEECFRRVDI